MNETNDERKKGRQMNPPVNVSFAAFPGARYEDAIVRGLETNVYEPLLGTLATDHVQLVPQTCRERLNDARVAELISRFPETQFRLHANVRVAEKHIMHADLASWDVYPAYFEEVARISKALRAPAYSAHAGERSQGDFSDVVNAARRAADLFDCPVAVEGHYPSPGNRYNISSWGEYRELSESGVPYALDLSHLNIVSHHSRRKEDTLVAEMLACERCIEVHLSDNNGNSDQHRTLATEPWWWSLRHHINTGATVFSEGSQNTARSLS